MAEPTLKDVIDQLKKNNDSLERQNAEVSSAVIALGNAIKGLTGNKNLKALDNLEASREKRAGRKDKERVAAGAGGKTRGSFGMLGGALAGAGVGIGAMGAGIGAFFMGLAGAEGIMSKFGTGDNLKKMMVNLSEGLASFDNRSLVALGAVLGAGALFGAVPIISGMGAGIGVAAMGLGIGAFFSGLAAGDMTIGAMEATGKNLSQFMGNFADGLSKLDNKSMIMLGGLLAAGGGFAALFGVGKAAKGAIGMALLGGGIAGFFAALGAGDMAIGKMEATGESLSALIGNLAEGLGKLDNESLVKIIGLIGAGGAFGAFFGINKTAKTTVGMTLFATGFAAGITALGAVPEAAKKFGLGTGNAFKNLVTNIGEGLGALDSKGFLFISGAIAAGGALGALFGPSTVAKAAVGMVAVGIGIGGFISTLAGITDLAGAMGATGESFKIIMTNIGKGFEGFNAVESGVLEKVTALGLVGPAIATFVASLGAASLGEKVISTFKSVWGFISGQDVETNMTTARTNQIQAIVDSLEPLKGLDVTVADKMIVISRALGGFARAIKEIAGINIEKFQKGFRETAEALAGQVQVLDKLANGGDIPATGFFSFFKSPIKFPEGGILNPNLKLDQVADAIAKAQFVLGQRNSPFLLDDNMRGMSLNEAVAARSNPQGGGFQNIIAPTTNNVSNNGSTFAISANDVSDMDAYRLRYGRVGF